MSLLDRLLARCDLCGSEQVDAKDVERMMYPGVVGALDEERLRWRMMKVVDAVVERSFVGKNAGNAYPHEIGVEKRVHRCPCKAVIGVPAAQLMIREQYRQLITEKFGETMPLTLLFCLPHEVVAWECAALANVTCKKNELVLSARGESLIGYVRGLAARRFFQTQTRFELKDIAGKFSYLHMIKPRYRSFVASDFGPEVTMEDLFTCTPVDWFDWVDMFNLRVHVEDGQKVVSRVVGAPLMSQVLSLLSMENGLNEPVVKGTRVVTDMACVQMMPTDGVETGAFVKMRYAWEQGPYTGVELHVGTTFLPNGRVAMYGKDLVAIFPPGVSVRTHKGSLVSSPAGVAVFLNGSVIVHLMADGVDRTEYESRTQTSVGYDFTIPVSVESYAEGTGLWKWYRRRFDRLSTEARFASSRADMILLSDPLLVDMPVVKQAKMLHGTLGGGGVVSDRNVYNRVKRGVRFKYEGSYRAFSVPGLDPDDDEMDTYNRCDLSLGGQVVLRRDVVVSVRPTYVIPIPSVTLDKIYDSEDDEHFPSEGYGTVTVDVLTIADEYQIDRGGPSASDGEYYDETITYGGDKMAAIPLIAFGKNGMDAVLSLSSFTCIMDDVQSVMHLWGDGKTVRDLLEIQAAYFNLAELSKTSVKYDGFAVSIANAGFGDMSWEEFIVSVAAWACVKPQEYAPETLGMRLASMFPKSLGNTVIKQHSFTH